MSKETDEVVSLERKFWTNGNDPAFFQEAMADKGIAVIEPMAFIEKAQAVAMSAKGHAFKDVVFKDVIVRELAPDCLAILYHGQGSPEGGDKPFQGSICSVYVKRAGRWQMALTVHQPWKPDGAKGS